jgi:hypothetical protein
LNGVLVVAIASAVGAVGCLPADGAFHCSSDTACIGAGVAGTCQPTGYCSFPDGSCANGRYGALSGALSNQCVSSVTADAGHDSLGPDAPPTPPTMIGTPVYASAGSATTLSFAMDIPSAANTLLVVSVELSASATVMPTISTITYAGVALTKIKAVVGAPNNAPNDAATRSEQWDMIAPATSGDVVVTLAMPGVTIHGNAMAFAGVDQTNPIRDIEGAYGDDASTSTVSVMSGAYDLVESTAGQGTSISSVMAPATLEFLDNGNGSTSLNNAAGATSPGAAGTVSVTWMYGGPDIWQEIVASLRPAT